MARIVLFDLITSFILPGLIEDSKVRFLYIYKKIPLNRNLNINYHILDLCK